MHRVTASAWWLLILAPITVALGGLVAGEAGIIMALKLVWSAIALRGLWIAVAGYLWAGADMRYQMMIGTNGPQLETVRQRRTRCFYQIVVFLMILGVGLLAIVSPPRGAVIDDPWERLVTRLTLILNPALLMGIVWMVLLIVEHAERGQASLIEAVRAAEQKAALTNRPGGRRWDDTPHPEEDTQHGPIG